MIENLRIKGFKRFEDESFNLKPLTVLAGRNGAGKTSTIHALLLAHHAVTRNDGVVELNGPYGLELGWFDDIINTNSHEDQFSVEVVGNQGQRGEWTFSQGSTEQYAKVIYPASDAWGLLTETRSFQYLAAERDGPRITQRTSALPIEMLATGCRGQFVAQVLEKLGGHTLDEQRIAPAGDATPLIKAQTEAWLSRITRPINIDTTTVAGTDIATLAFRDPGGEWVRPTNMGFGVSYALPVILAAMTAPRGGVMLVENPEAHLHPSGQSEIGMFLARMAAAGIQVVVETHSDHVINGIRRAIGELQILTPTDATVLFFPDSSEPVLPLDFTATGGISQWPKGFLDQYQLDVAKITRVRRPR